MKTLYLDTFSGISGDMLLGALVDAGLSIDALREGLRTLSLEGYSLRVESVFRGPFRATRLHVDIDDAPPLPPPAPRAPQDAHTHTHEHEHNAHEQHDHHHHSHQHHHLDQEQREAHSHTHAHSEQHGLTRGYRAIVDLLERGSLSPRSRKLARAVFKRIGEAEARAHGVSLEEVHFHEVGAVDSIVDIVGACIALELLGVERVVSSPMTLGSGFAHGAHGTFPLPAPATIEILRGVPSRQTETRFELTTPTGAALAATLASDFGPMPELRVEAVGYGAGNDRPTAVPNVLRVVLGEADSSRAAAELERDRVAVLETHVDDMSAEWLAHLAEKLLDAGALDVTLTPILMKKGRPAHALCVIARPGDAHALETVLFRESTTIGIRVRESDRVTLPRELVTVSTPLGDCRVKLARLGEEIVNAQPEHEDLRRLASTSGRPLKEVHAAVMRALDAESGEDSRSDA